MNGDDRDFRIPEVERIRMNLLDHLRTFVAIADAGSLVGGARRRHVSAPTATRALSGLEAHLGVRLVVRTTRALRLTEVGEAYLAQALTPLLTQPAATEEQTRKLTALRLALQTPQPPAQMAASVIRFYL